MLPRQPIIHNVAHVASIPVLAARTCLMAMAARKCNPRETTPLPCCGADLYQTEVRYLLARLQEFDVQGEGKCSFPELMQVGIGFFSVFQKMLIEMLSGL